MPLQKESRSQDSLFLHHWPQEFVPGLLPRIPRGAVVKKTSEEAADKVRQFCLLNHGEDPGVIDAGIGGSKVRQ